jgi:integrase/recombinase XerD
MGSPVVTIFVRHGEGCKHSDDEFSKKCKCRKHFRWSHNGTQFRRAAGTRSWAEAEEIKRQLQDELSGKTPETRPEDNVQPVSAAIEIFIADKTQGVSAGVVGKYQRELDRLRDYCECHGVYTVQAITRELLANFCGTWETVYPSSNTRSKVRERLSSFLRYSYDVQWTPRVLKLPKIKVEAAPTLPLTDGEYARLLAATNKVSSKPAQCARVRALFQLMRYSGLAIRDALTLERVEIQHDTKKDLHRIVTARQKTGTHVSVPIPPIVAKELMDVENDNKKYVFWSGNGDEESITKNWAKYYVAPAFAEAKITGGHMMSHRLRDTFAVDLLTKGVPLEEVSKLLGHESIKTTERHYAKWIKGRQDRLDSLVMATW